MSLLDKIKQSASDAAKKAQQTVEITKLKSQISGKEKDQEKLCLQIEQLLFIVLTRLVMSQNLSRRSWAAVSSLMSFNPTFR